MTAPRTPRKKPAEKRRERQEEAAVAQEKKAPVQGRTPNQKKYLHAIKTSDVTICYGPAGTGKTFMPAAYAAELMMVGHIDNIIMCRPMVEAGGEKMGALPGGIESKMAPWTAPIIQTLNMKLGAGVVKEKISQGKIKVVPFAYMRGLTFDDSFVLFDEAQNSTKEMMKLVTGRLGENTKLVISGDLAQCDIHTPRNGLDAIIRAANLMEMRSVSVVKMGKEDIVRSFQCRQWIEAWEVYEGGAELEATDPRLPGFITG